jgi:hypothetical protein
LNTILAVDILILGPLQLTGTASKYRPHLTVKTRFNFERPISELAPVVYGVLRQFDVAEFNLVGPRTINHDMVWYEPDAHARWQFEQLHNLFLDILADRYAIEAGQFDGPRFQPHLTVARGVPLSSCFGSDAPSKVAAIPICFSAYQYDGLPDQSQINRIAMAAL